MKHYTDYSLKSLHTFGMDVRTAHFVEYTSVDELEALLVRMQSEWETLPWLHMGGGSNLLFTSDYYQGVILHFGHQRVASGGRRRGVCPLACRRGCRVG